jgi:putative transposase
MDLRRCFTRDHLRRSLSIADLCHHYGISRQTGYKGIGRFEAEGTQGLRPIFDSSKLQVVL